MSDRPAVLIMQPHLAPLTAFLESAYTVYRFWEGPPVEAQNEIRALVVAGEFPLDKHLIESLPRLQDWDLMLRYTSIFQPLYVNNIGVFYRRNVALSPMHAYETWLNEMTAMVTEDLMSAPLASFNPIGNLRLPQYLGRDLGYASFNCNLQQWTSYSNNCESYSVSGSFGGFLVRHLGVDLVLEPEVNAVFAEIQKKITALARSYWPTPKSVQSI